MLNEKNQIITFINSVLDVSTPKKDVIIKNVLKQIFDENDILIAPVEPMAIIIMTLHEISLL